MKREVNGVRKRQSNSNWKLHVKSKCNCFPMDGHSVAIGGPFKSDGGVEKGKKVQKLRDVIYERPLR